MVASAQAMDKLQSPIAAWLRKLGPFEMTERTFEHCVSPSPPGKRARPGASRVGRVRTATAATGLCIHRKSQKPPSTDIE